MWWLLFTAIDVYIGIVALDVLARSGSIPEHKLTRLALIKKILVFVTAAIMLAFFVKLWQHVRH